MPRGRPKAPPEPRRRSVPHDAPLFDVPAHMLEPAAERRRIEFFVAGYARGKARPRVTRNGVYTPPETERAAELVAYTCRQAMGRGLPLDGPVFLGLRAIYPLPASWTKAERAATLWKTSKPDLDNVLKLVKDALNMIAWIDDAQVVASAQVKVYGETPGIHILIRATEWNDYMLPEA